MMNKVEELSEEERIAIRTKAYEIISKFTKNEFLAFILFVLGGHDVRELTELWPKLESVFIIEDGKIPTPHPETFVVMGMVANERTTKEAGK